MPTTIARIWQKIEGACHSCHCWQEQDERKITAMSEILISAIAVLVLLAGVVALVRYARRDAFAAPGTGYKQYDELGALGFRRRPA